MESSKHSTSDEIQTCVLTVKNKMGIHARPAAMIVRISNKFSHVELWVEKEGQNINGKSIMGLMMLAAGQGSELKFTATGQGSAELLEELNELFERKFEEA